MMTFVPWPMHALQTPRFAGQIDLQGVITVVAAIQLLELKGVMSQLARAQIAAADRVMLSKIDLASEAQLSQTLDWHQKVNPVAPKTMSTHGDPTNEYPFISR